MDNNINDTFHKYFEIIPAITEELKTEVYKLRYQIYCIETGFLNAQDYTNDMEYDHFDTHSVHYLIRHRASQEYAATTRLILPHPEYLEKPFQLEDSCRIENFEILKTTPRTHLGEISRLCISKEFKKRKNEANTLAAINKTWHKDTLSQDDRRNFPHLTLALFACLIKASYEHDIHCWYAVMEPALFRFFNSLGIHFTKIGPLAEFHGKRWPCIIKIADLLEGTAAKNIQYWELLTNNGAWMDSATPN